MVMRPVIARSMKNKGGSQRTAVFPHPLSLTAMKRPTAVNPNSGSDVFSARATGK
jgi:hypothetical protein